MKEEGSKDSFVGEEKKGGVKCKKICQLAWNAMDLRCSINQV
jgi:hypothetical protein